MICFSYKLVDWTEEPMHLMLGSHSIFLCHYINQLFLQIFRSLELKKTYKKFRRIRDENIEELKSKNHIAVSFAPHN